MHDELLRPDPISSHATALPPRSFASLTDQVPRVRGLILIITDEQHAGETACHALAEAQYEIRASSDVLGAVAALAQDPVDLIVLDLELTTMSGLEVMRRVRQRDDGRTAIILLSAGHDDEGRVLGLRLGADDALAKPFCPDELVARVNAVLRRVTLPAGQRRALQFGELRIVQSPAARPSGVTRLATAMDGRAGLRRHQVQRRERSSRSDSASLLISRVEATAG